MHLYWECTIIDKGVIVHEIVHHHVHHAIQPIIEKESLYFLLISPCLIKPHACVF